MSKFVSLSDAGFNHPSWLTAVGTLAGYGLVLLVLFVALFVLPYLLFTL
ncbi:hypothetical protein [Halocatena pleomorpha]|nr:hypothetical protein [Halocatena pleomorpha]